MVTRRFWTLAGLVGAAATLGGCVTTPLLSVMPGQGKTYADLQRDDAACRAAPAATAPATASAETDRAYYQCMAARGEMVVANRTAAYPVYAGSPYYPYAYPYGYPYYDYPYYPYSAAYLGPYVGFGLGFGGFYGDRDRHGGFDHRGFRGGRFAGGPGRFGGGHFGGGHFGGGHFGGGHFGGGGHGGGGGAIRR